MENETGDGHVRLTHFVHVRLFSNTKTILRKKHGLFCNLNSRGCFKGSSFNSVFKRHKINKKISHFDSNRQAKGN